MMISACSGRSGGVRWPRRNEDGSLCQKDEVEAGVDRSAMTG